eukprot:XP_028356403.1 E3 ubiquitin-protein ligase RNF139 isoform X7 [Physeter catodon]
MAAVGPPQQQVRMAHQQVWVALEVALRVPCLYIIDAIFNSYYDSSQSRFCIGLQIFLRLLGFLMWKKRKKHFTELLASVKKPSSFEESQVNINMRKVTPEK